MIYNYISGVPNLECDVYKPKLTKYCIHIPIISQTAKHCFTDTTNNFHAHSRKYICHPKVKLIRNSIMTYALLAYLSILSSQLGLKTYEIPVTRAYPRGIPPPPKISSYKANSQLMKIFFKNLHGEYCV